MVVDNRGILPASYSISSVRHALRAWAGVIDIVVPCRWSDSPLPLVRRPIGPTAHWHWSENPLHWSEDSLVRKSVIGIAMPYGIAIGIGPKTIGIGPKTIGIGPKKHVIGLKTHWSEKVSLPMTLV